MADTRARISWLHVSDLHVTRQSVGRPAARRPGSALWAEVLRGFLADLDAQLDATGLRPDLVLVTGDLAYSGAAEQYADLDADLLHPLLAHLRARGCEAVPFAVPGNHDVQRPSGTAKLGYRLLREYDALDDQDEDLAYLRAALWQERNAAFLSPLFANYMAWAGRSMLPDLADRTLPSGLRIEGLFRSHLPGDLSVVVARDGLRVLLVGLNSAWIQFDGGDFKGKLHVPLEQLHAALATDEHAALRRFDDVDASLLLMHHPRDWLSPAAARTFDGYVYPARDERFTAFMFGHMHETRSETSSGNGHAMRYFYQSPSLFGLEHYGQTQARLDVGYTLGALYEDEEIRLWVRRLGKSGRFDVDPELHRQADGALVLRSGRARASPRITLLPDGERADQRVRPGDRAQLGTWLLSRHGKLELLAPNGTFSYPFDEIYIPLEIAMQEAWRSHSLERELEHHARDIELPEIFARARDDREVMIFGNPGAGKTTTLEKICHQMLTDGGEAVGLPRATLPLLLPLRQATREDLAQDDPLLQLARRELLRSDAPLSADGIERLWAQGELLLLLDGLDEVADVELRDGLVRHVVERAPTRRRRGIRHIVSSRSSGVTRAIREVLDSGFLRLDVRPLRRDRIEALVHSWFRAAKRWQVAPRSTEERARVEADARTEAEQVLAELRRIEHEDFEFKSLVATPLLLTLLCAVALANGQIPHKRPEFYQRCLEVLLRRHTQKTGRSTPVQEPEVLRILQEVAYGLHEARRRDGLSAESFAASASRRADRSSRARMGPAEAAELLRWLHQHAGVLTKFGDDDYGFSHLTFQEYLSALHIAYGGQEQLEALADRFGDPWWQEVTLLCLALPLRRTFEPFMSRVLEGERWLSDGLGEDGAPEVRRESKLPMQLLRECWEAADERSVEPFLRVLEQPRSGQGWFGRIRGLFGRPAATQERIDRQRIGVMQLLLGETNPRLVALAGGLSTDAKQSEAVQAIAAELVARAQRGAADELRPANAMPADLPVLDELDEQPDVTMAGPASDDRPASDDDDLGIPTRSEEKATPAAETTGAWDGAVQAKEDAAPSPLRSHEEEEDEGVDDDAFVAHEGDGAMARPEAEPPLRARPGPELARGLRASADEEPLEVETGASAGAWGGGAGASARAERMKRRAAPGKRAQQSTLLARDGLREVTALAPAPAPELAPEPQASAAPATSAAPAAKPKPMPAPRAQPMTPAVSRPSTTPVPVGKPVMPMVAPSGAASPVSVPLVLPPSREPGRLAPAPAEPSAPAEFGSAAPPPPMPMLADAKAVEREDAVVARGPVRQDSAAVPGIRAWPPSLVYEAAPPPIDIDDVCVEPTTKMRLLWVRGGSFMMGSEEDEPDAGDDERPRHLVELRGFWLAETPVTNAQYAEYVKADGDAREPRYWRDRGLSGRDQPVVAVSWQEARAFCAWLSRESGWIITLPSEAQWEYAARGKDGRRYPWGNDPPDETRACFGLRTSTGRTAPVGQYPHGRGPFRHLDLAGNVWEWCRDAGDDPSAYARAEAWSEVDPVIEDLDAKLRVCRGGGWYDPAHALRTARRSFCPAVGSSIAQGFRVCRLLASR